MAACDDTQTTCRPASILRPGRASGEITDNRSGLVWLQDATCFGPQSWQVAVEITANLADLPATSAGAADDCGLSDGSSPGEWRLPSVAEWEAMVADALGIDGDPDCTVDPPTLTNDSGDACWTVGPSSFPSVPYSNFWTSTTLATTPDRVHFMGMDGVVYNGPKSPGVAYFWPVRGGQ